MQRVELVDDRGRQSIAGRGPPRVEIVGQLAAVSCGVFEGASVLDLDYAEDSNAEADANFVITKDGLLVEVQGTAEGAPFSRAQFGEMLDLASDGVAELCAAQTAALAAA